jgi:hypothetical protein
MIAAAHLDNWLFILLVVVAMLFRWLTSVASKANKNSNDTDQSATPPPIPRAPAQSDEERIRKFLEALGQPAGSSPPPPVAPRQMDAERAAQESRLRVEQAKRAAEQKKKIFVPKPGLPPLTTFPLPIPVESQSGPAVIATEKLPRISSTVAEATIFEVHEARDPESRPAVRAASSANANIMAWLKSPAGLRNAIILREVFGPPRSLQPLELL